MDIGRIGKFLAELRKQKGMTQEQLGELLGVTNKTVSRWETGAYLPPVEILQRLSDLYGITINEILSTQRLSEEEYRVKAEENIKTAIRYSFTLKERQDFFKKKWKKDHIADFVLVLVIVIVLYAAGIFWLPGLQVAGYILLIAYLTTRNNRMMAYVETHAFDGSGQQ